MKAVHATTLQKANQGWKFIFPLLALFLCLSCNKDDDEAPAPTPPPTSFLKVTIDGTEYNFNRFVVETETVVEPDYTYVDLHVIATIDGDDSKQIDFNLEQDVAGSETIYYFALTNGDEYFETDLPNAAFPTNVTVNANKHLVGTLSGTLVNATPETTTITNGSFDITY